MMPELAKTLREIQQCEREWCAIPIPDSRAYLNFKLRILWQRVEVLTCPLPLPLDYRKLKMLAVLG